mgnify:CR=1 FL=1
MTTNTSAPNTTNTLTEQINENYEWIQYNEHLRLIHSIKDDMYQMQSIINACNSRKEARHWFRNESTKEFLEAFDNELASGRKIPDDETEGGRKIPPSKSWEKRMELSPGLQGIYVHKLLVNHIAMWASPRYSIYIMMLLDKYYENERKKNN